MQRYDLLPDTVQADTNSQIIRSAQVICSGGFGPAVGAFRTDASDEEAEEFTDGEAAKSKMTVRWAIMAGVSRVWHPD